MDTRDKDIVVRIPGKAITGARWAFSTVVLAIGTIGAFAMIVGAAILAIAIVAYMIAALR